MHWKYRAAAALSALALTLAACSKQDAPPPNQSTPPGVTVALPIVASRTAWDYYPARLAAMETVDLRARVSGKIIAADFIEGGIVEKDAVLFKIDPLPFRAQLDSSKGQLVQAQAKLELAKNDLARGIAAGGVVSAEELDTRRQNVEQARGVVLTAQAVVENDTLNLEWTNVTAPIRGQSSRKLVTPGNLVTGGAGQGTLLTSITSIDPIYCYVDADENSVLRYQRLAEKKRRISARDSKIPCFMQLSDETVWHEGVIDFVDNHFNPATGTLLARGVFPNPTGKLISGNFARFRVLGESYTNAIMVVDEAIGTEQNTRFVRVVKSDNTVEIRTVTPGPLIGKLRIIESGLGAEDRVVINGLLRTRPHASVTPQLVPMPDNPPGEQPPTLAPTTKADSAPATTSQPHGGAP